MMPTLCPCGLSKPFEQCCSPIIKGKQIARTAEQLMRSRYSAFTQVDVDYLMLSHHPNTRDIKEKKQLKTWAESVTWLRLVILNSSWGNENDKEGHVEFRALYSENGKMLEIHENSLFQKVNDKWVYVSGIHL